MRETRRKNISALSRQQASSGEDKIKTGARDRRRLRKVQAAGDLSDRSLNSEHTCPTKHVVHKSRR